MGSMAASTSAGSAGTLATVSSMFSSDTMHLLSRGFKDGKDG